MSEERRIKFIQDESLHEAGSMPDQFLHNEKGITKEALDQYVDHLLKVIREKTTELKMAEKQIYVLDTLREDRLIQMFAIYNSLDEIGDGNYYNPKTGDYITIQEMKKAISGIRNAIIKKLADHLDPDDYYLTLEDLQNSSASTADNNIYAIESKMEGKAPKIKVYRGNKIASDGTDGMQAAFEKLTKIPPHENVVSIYNKDATTSDTITEYLGEIKNIEGLIEFIKELEDVKKIMMIVDDGVKGAIHLLQQGIIIMDICPENIGYTEEDKIKGILFDLEACAMSGTKTVRLAHAGYFPPEYNPDLTIDYENKPSITEKEPVYQFGKILKLIKSYIDDSKLHFLDPEFIKKFTELQSISISKNPEDRPTLEELHLKLQHLISLI